MAGGDGKPLAFCGCTNVNIYTTGKLMLGTGGVECAGGARSQAFEMFWEGVIFKDLGLDSYCLEPLDKGHAISK